MTFLEPIIAAIIGAAAGAIALALKNNAKVSLFLKYGNIVKKAYDIVDPILDKNLQHWNGSKVDKAFELTIESVADGTLSADEIKKLAFYMSQAWLPQVAADKVRKLETSSSQSPALLEAMKITSRVNSFFN